MKSAPGRAPALVIAGPNTADASLRESQRLFRPRGLTGTQFNVLNLPAEATAEVSQRELGDRLGVDRSTTVTGLLDRMEKAGWVRREDPPEDRRCYLIVLTPAGRAMWGQGNPPYLEAVGQVTAGLGAKRMDDCRAPLATFERNATAMEPDWSRR